MKAMQLIDYKVFHGADYSALRPSPCRSPSGRSPPLRGVVEPSFCLSAVRISADQSGSVVGRPSSLIYWITKLIPATHRGRGMGTWVCAFFAGQFVSPLMFSAAPAAVGGVLSAFVLVGATGTLAAVIAIAYSGSNLVPRT